VPEDGAPAENGGIKEGEKAKRKKGEKEQQAGACFAAESGRDSLVRIMVFGEKRIEIEGFLSFSPFSLFALKFFIAVGPHMALSLYQKEGRCVR
jgi:hypothetical protein